MARTGQASGSIRSAALVPLVVVSAITAEITAGGRHAFTMIPIRPSDELALGLGSPAYPVGALTDVVRINSEGDVLAIFEEGGVEYAWVRLAPPGPGDDGGEGGSAERLWNEATWIRITDAEEDSTTGSDLNDAATIVGGVLDDGGRVMRGMEWIAPGAFHEYFKSGFVHGINSIGEACGCAHDGLGQTPVARFTDTFAWFELPEAEDWDGHCALALSERRLHPIEGAMYLSMAGMAQNLSGSEPVVRAVVWQARGESDIRYRELSGWTNDLARGPHPTGVNSSGLVTGWFETQAGAVLPKIWIPQDDFSIDYSAASLPRIGGYNPAWDVNESGEVACELGLWAWNGHYGDDHAFTWLPVAEHVNFPLGSDPHSLVLRSINDDGVMVGMIDIDSGGDLDTIVIIYPHDTDNDRVPDFREIVSGAEDDLDDDLVIDDAQVFRPGMHGTGDGYARNFPADDDAINAVRQIMTSGEIGRALRNCKLQREHLRRYIFGVDRSFSREMLICLRQPYALDPSRDAIPDPVTEQPAYLQRVERFTMEFGDCLDYIQLGNEIYSGAGMMFFPEMGESGKTFGQIWGADLESGFAQTFAWYELVSEAARKGSARNADLPRPLRIVGPAPIDRDVRGGSICECDPTTFAQQSDPNREPHRQANVVYFTIQFANQVCDIMDVHLHYIEPDHFDQAFDAITDRSTNQPWIFDADDAPEQLSATEWGPFPDFEMEWTAANWNDGARVFDFFDEDPETPAGRNWNDIIDARLSAGPWSNSPSYARFGIDLAAPRLAHRNSDRTRFIFGMYAGWRQWTKAEEVRWDDHSNFRPWDLVSVDATNVDHDPGVTKIWGDGSDGWLKATFDQINIDGFHPHAANCAVMCTVKAFAPSR